MQSGLPRQYLEAWSYKWIRWQGGYTLNITMMLRSRRFTIRKSTGTTHIFSASSHILITDLSGRDLSLTQTKQTKNRLHNV